MLRIDLRVRPEHMMEALDRLMPRLPLGLHRVDEGDTVLLVALGEPHQLTPAGELADALAELLVEPPREVEVDDLHSELDRLRPAFTIGERVHVRPSGAPAPEGDVIDVVIDRASGFGTGAHPTTRMSLELLLDVKPGGSLTDLGCGAGVIAIAAAKLGWEPVTGLDFNDSGVAEARANAERNGVAATFELADLREAPLPPARVAVANVSETDVHVRLSAHEWDGLETLIMAGLRKGRDLDPIVARYEQAGFTERDRREKGHWVAVRFDR